MGNEPIYHLRSYGDVSKAELDYYTTHGTLDGFPNGPAGRERVQPPAPEPGMWCESGRSYVWSPGEAHPAPTLEPHDEAWKTKARAWLAELRKSEAGEAQGSAPDWQELRTIMKDVDAARWESNAWTDAINRLCNWADAALTQSRK